MVMLFPTQDSERRRSLARGVVRCEKVYARNSAKAASVRGEVSPMHITPNRPRSEKHGCSWCCTAV